MFCCHQSFSHYIGEACYLLDDSNVSQRIRKTFPGSARIVQYADLVYWNKESGEYSCTICESRSLGATNCWRGKSNGNFSNIFGHIEKIHIDELTFEDLMATRNKTTTTNKLVTRIDLENNHSWKLVCDTMSSVLNIVVKSSSIKLELKRVQLERINLKKEIEGTLC